MRALALLLVASLGSVAAADPAAKLSPADHKVYAAQLAKGRQLEAAGKHAAAITAFEAGLKVAPDDATLLGEIGASAYLGKDLAKAESATRKSLANAAAPNLRGASLYNLGRILEDRQDKAGAVAAYSESLRARPNSVVRARLTQLDAAAAAALDPYKPAPLAGPFASIDAFCKSVPPNAGDADMNCTCGPTSPADAPTALPAPYQQVQLFSRDCRYHAVDAGYTDYKLGVKLAGGWYVAVVEHVDENRHCSSQYAFTEAKSQDVAAAPGSEVLVRYGVTGNCVGGSESEDWTEDRQLVIGLGAGKAPAATPPLLRKRHEVSTADMFDHPDRTKVTADVALDFAWGADGTFTVTGKTTGIDKAEAASLLGKHVLSFP